MILENQFTVAAPMGRVFDALQDATSVAGSLPGARLGIRIDERTVKGELRLTLGTTLIPYRGTLRIERSDRRSGTLALTLDAREGRGQGTAQATVDVRMQEVGGFTTVTVRSDVSVVGRAAKVARDDIHAAVQGLLTQFGDNLGQRIVAAAVDGAGAAAAPVAGSERRGAVPAEKVAGSVRLMTAEPVPVEKVAPLEGLSAVVDGLRRRPWVPAALVGISLLVLALLLSSRRR